MHKASTYVTPNQAAIRSNTQKVVLGGPMVDKPVRMNKKKIRIKNRKDKKINKENE